MLKAYAIAATLVATPLFAQDLSGDLISDIAGNITRVSGFAGEMTVTMGSEDSTRSVKEVLRFEPWQMLEELFRDDIVLLMRHGPTDWSKRDPADVAPDDCENQRVMTEEGKQQMRELGILMVANDILC